MGCTKSMVWSIHHISSRHQKISLGHQHWSIGGRSDIRSDNTDFYKFLFLNLGHLQHRTDTGYHTTREQGQHQEQLAGLGEGRLDDTLPCFWLCSLRVVSDTLFRDLHRSNLELQLSSSPRLVMGYIRASLVGRIGKASLV